MELLFGIVELKKVSWLSDGLVTNMEFQVRYNSVEGLHIKVAEFVKDKDRLA